MFMDITARNSIIEEMSEYFTKEDAHDRGKIKKANAFVGVTVAADCSRLGEEDGGTDVDTNCPGENKTACVALVAQLRGTLCV